MVKCDKKPPFDAYHSIALTLGEKGFKLCLGLDNAHACAFDIRPKLRVLTDTKRGPRLGAIIGQQIEHLIMNIH